MRRSSFLSGVVISLTKTVSAFFVFFLRWMVKSSIPLLRISWSVVVSGIFFMFFCSSFSSLMSCCAGSLPLSFRCCWRIWCSSWIFLHAVLRCE